MDNRLSDAQGMLAQSGWAGSETELIAGDASNRRYFRLTKDADTAILMDAPPSKGESVAPFVTVATYLRAQGLSAPRVYGKDLDLGFLVLEDLGDAIFARVLERDPDLEFELYAAATDVLVHLRNAPSIPLSRFDSATMTDLCRLTLDWYPGGEDTLPTDTYARFLNELNAGLAPLDKSPTVVIQRDYHAENLIWCPDRDGVARVGLLDFQDAVIGHPAYDLVSVLQDARRDVSEDVENAMIDRYVRATGTNESAFRTAYAWLGVQRQLRILGVFARLSLAYGKPHYIDFVPRVWGHLVRNLEHDTCAELRKIVHAVLPEPTHAHLSRLRHACGTHPIPS